MDSLTQSVLEWLQPMVSVDVKTFVFFQLVNDYLTSEIHQFGLDVMGRAMIWVNAIALTLVTLWIMMLGYQLATGQSRQNAVEVMTKAARIVFILAVAGAVGANGTLLHRTMTTELDEEIHYIFTGSDQTAAKAIDENLAYTQIALAAVDAVQLVPGDGETLEKKTRALFFAGAGTAGPAMVAGAMLLLFQFTIAFLIGVGPIFILCLMFDQTKDLFKKWLFYLVGTLFSMGMLSAVSAIVLKLMIKVAGALWLSKAILGSDAEGMSTQALQQGGIGMLLTVLLISMPTAAAALWQGSMSSFMHFSAFSGGAASSPGAQGQPIGSQVGQRTAESTHNQAHTSRGEAGETQYAGRSAYGSATPSTPAPGTRGQANVNNDKNNT